MIDADALGKAAIPAGASGAGQAAKICNNMILGATMPATCEAFALAKTLGLDAQTFQDIAGVSSGQWWSTGAPTSPAASFFRLPPKLPIAVRTSPTMGTGP